ncbi:MAG: M2 family metallopeptidase [Bacteroidales bacterium]|nr:M2 family metallopeptidase [Bacteroidales bacterium]
MKRKIFVSAMMAGSMMLSVSCTDKTTVMENKLSDFIQKHEQLIKPLNRDGAIAYWDASISGKDEDYARAEKLNLESAKVYSNTADFQFLKEIKESRLVQDEMLKRQLEVLYHAYLSKQVNVDKLEAIIKLETEVEKKYASFRAEIDGEKLSDNEIEDLLRESDQSEVVKTTWMASKEIGPIVAEDVRNLVRLRNAVAVELGFVNYHDMSLRLADQNPAELDQLFDELDDLTRDAFAGLKDEIDVFLAKRFNITQEELMPWHYQNRYFQEAPKIYNVDLDQYYKEQNLEKLTAEFFDGIGLNIDDMLAASDLYEKEGKYQHAYCMDVDREGDVRIVCNIKPNNSWMNTMLHEYGHGVYDKFNDRELPYTLREPAHIFTTEAIAMLFGRFASNGQWMQDMGIINAKEKEKISEESFNSLRLEQLVFSRWAQVMYRFEKAMYADPEQDLNKLWWDIVEKYQMISRPEGRDMPDWATKIHVATVPCYYHNYLLGELFASQLYYYITANVVKSNDFRNQSFVGNPETGKYLTENVFKPGSRWYWNTMIEKATGEKLTARYYALQFVK